MVAAVITGVVKLNVPEANGLTTVPLYQSTVLPASVVALIRVLPLLQIAGGGVIVGAAGSGFTVTVTALLVAD